MSESEVEGLRIKYGPGNRDVSISSGAAWVPGLQRVVEAPGATDLPQPGTWMYCYVGLIEEGDYDWENLLIVDEPPGEPYAGSARTLPHDPNWRYVGVYR